MAYPKQPDFNRLTRVLAEFGAPDWDAGWLLTYIAVYLFVMLLWRTVLRIP